MAPTPAAPDIPGVMPTFGPTARRGWRQAPPPPQASAIDAEYWRQRQAMLLAESENRRLDHENRQRAELERSIAETLAAAGRPIDDGECSLAETDNKIRCSNPALQAAIKGQEAALIALHQAIAKADRAGAVELLQVRDGRLRLPHRQ